MDDMNRTWPGDKKVKTMTPEEKEKRIMASIKYLKDLYTKQHGVVGIRQENFNGKKKTFISVEYCHWLEDKLAEIMVLSENDKR